MWQYQNTDELYHHGVLGMRWGFRKSKKDAILRSKVHGKMNTDIIRYNGNKKRAVRTRTAKNIAITGLKTAVLAKIGYNAMKTGKFFYKNDIPIKVNGVRNPNIESMVKKIIVGTSIAVGSAAVYGTGKSITKGLKKQSYINEYKSNKK